MTPARLRLESGASTFARHARQRSTHILLTAGVAAVLLHALTRVPLHLPGHEGLVWMAILMLARLISPYRWAATVVAMGAAAAASFLGFHDALAPLGYLLPGVVLDLATLASARNPIVMVLGAALGYCAHPALDWLALHALGVTIGPAQVGLATAFGSHLGFGLAGALIGAALWRTTRG